MFGTLEALVRDQYWFSHVSNEYSELSDGLPYFLQDLWPQGFIGRTVPRRYPELALPERVTDWNDGHVLTYLSQRGEDCMGNLLLGDESLQRYLRLAQQSQTPIAVDDRIRRYPQLADEAIAGTLPGSSAGGEHPKFTATSQLGSTVRPVLVKFSPVEKNQASRRWSDLLIAEHMASKALSGIGIAASSTELVMAGNRMFLEIDRFDRVGERGRIGIVSLSAVVDHYIGRRDNWISASNSLRALGKISTIDAEAVRRIATFGQLIGNTDMHFGNLSFFLSLERPLALTPVYDMLPMIYAPVAGDEVPIRHFEPPLPGSTNLDIWASLAEAAEVYWRDVSGHDLVSADFASIARTNAQAISRARKLIH
jgi:hypothetical protein